MFLRSSQRAIFLFFLQLILLSLSPTVYPAPVGLIPYDTLVRRSISTQDNFQPSTITVVSQINTSMGPATETCNITLTPIMSNGQQKVQEVKQCAIVLDGSGGSASAGTNGSSTSTSSSSCTSSSQTQSGTSTSSSSTSSTSSTATPSGSAGPIPAVKVNGVSTVPAATPSPPSSMSSSQTQLGTSTSSSSTSSTSSAANPSGSAGPIPAVKVNGVSTVPAATPSSTTSSSSGSSSPSGIPVAAAAAASALTSPSAAASATQAAAFAIPGRKLSVLPIGLGVFAGVAVIAIIVVSLVTYERTKYRKAFRQRKLAEAGQQMGYGGMGDRT